VTLLGLTVAYKALQSYILWGEGTSDPDGSVLAKSVLRVLVYMGISGLLATTTFTFGLELAQVIAASPMMSAAQTTHGLIGEMAMLPSNLIGFDLGLPLAVLGGVLLMVVVMFQMAIRAAELIVYFVASPLVALGQLNSGGGTWTNWWANLVILSLSQGVVILCFKGFVATTQVLTAAKPLPWVSGVLGSANTAAAFGQAAVADALLPARILLIVLFMIGWMVVAIRGPHLLQQWSYRSGVGGGGMFISQRVGPGMLTKASPRLGAYLK
jgi:hypothetical protein